MSQHLSLEEVLAMDGVPGMPEVPQQPDELKAEEDVSFLNRPFYVNKMLKTIEEVKEYSWKRGEIGGLDWGYDSMNKAFEGLNTGVHLIAGQSNIGG